MKRRERQVWSTRAIAQIGSSPKTRTTRDPSQAFQVVEVQFFILPILPILAILSIALIALNFGALRVQETEA
jgi:hypothetical protein